MNLSDFLPEIKHLIQSALDEDLPNGDVTTESLIDCRVQGQATLISKACGILAGVEIAKLVFLQVDPSLKFTILDKDGSTLNTGNLICRVEGHALSILKAERTALNFLQHLCGIATTTAQYVEAIKGFPVKILDTRKTIPGLRLLEKYAVSVGGGTNHRMNLSEAFLIKDNHIAILRSQQLDIEKILLMAKKHAPAGMQIEIETTSPEEALIAAKAGADIVMLDNMSLAEMRRAVELIDHRAVVEASGGITLENIRAVAETGVDCISVGALTHSTKSLDISLNLKF